MKRAWRRPDLYLQARALQIRRGMHGMLESIGPLEQAIAIDAAFAPAYAGLGAAYALRSIQFPEAHPADELEKMRSAVAKAVQLDPLLAEAHAARALAFARDSRWEEAEQSFHRAIELDPNRSSTYTDFALWVLYVLGRNDEALGQLRMAEKSDVLSPDVHLALALTLTSTGQFEQAAAECLKMPARDTLAKQCLARTKLGEGKFDEAIPLLVNDPNPQSLGLPGLCVCAIRPTRGGGETGPRVDVRQRTSADFRGSGRCEPHAGRARSDGSARFSTRRDVSELA